MTLIPAPVAADGHALKAAIKERAEALGFDRCGVTDAAPPDSQPKYLDWLARGHHADMAWMARPDRVAKCGDLQQVLAGAQSVVCVAMLYRTREEDAPWDEQKQGKVARYARGTDYHEIMPARLRELLAWIKSQAPCEGRVYADTGPLLERDLAQRAGVGWIGKNTLVMSRELGSYFLLGEIVLDLKLPPDAPHAQSFCGSCTRCLDACPTNAIVAPRELDASKCISFHTIENRLRLPQSVKDQVGDWLFGCDICQEVCPWNERIERVPDAHAEAFSSEPDLWKREEFPAVEEWVSLGQSEFSRRLSKSPLKRPKRRGMKRNALAVLKSRRARRKQPAYLGATDAS
jgi:epoxyqueuosine reductase